MKRIASIVKSQEPLAQEVTGAESMQPSGSSRVESRRRGAAAIEYAAVLSLVVVGAIVGIQQLGGAVAGAFGAAGTRLGAGAASSAGSSTSSTGSSSTGGTSSGTPSGSSSGSGAGRGRAPRSGRVARESR